MTEATSDLLIGVRFLEMIDSERPRDAMELCQEDVILVAYERGAIAGKTAVAHFLHDNERFCHRTHTWTPLQFVQNTVDDDIDIQDDPEILAAERDEDTTRHLIFSMRGRKGVEHAQAPASNPSTFLSTVVKEEGRSYSVLEREGAIGRSFRWYDYRRYKVKDTVIIRNHKIQIFVRQRRF